ncbi:ABC transporter substrate-binding protein [Facklamia sp. P12934]|uniref:ABC transporter substrate-binding protein n=1 Tax=unclassified Facklamia TaxID=2622293 RepID=UPI003D16E11C
MKKVIKKLMVGLLSASMSVASVLPLSQTVQAAEPVKLSFWHGMGGSVGEALQKLVDQYNESQDAVEVDAQYQGSYDETLTKLRSSASGSEVGADVVQVFEVGTTFMIDSGLTVPIQDYVDKTDFDLDLLEPNLLAYFTIEDRLHSMPFNNSTPLMYYNKDIFDKAGVEVPTTLEDLIEIGPKLQEAGAAMPASIGIYGWWIDQWFNKMEKEIFDYANGRDGAPESVAFIENGGMEKILTMWKKGVDAGVMPNVGREGGHPEFIAGQSAITFGSTASLRQLLTEVDGRFEIGTAYYPGIDSEDKGGVSIGGASLWMIESDDEAKKDAAWDFIQFLVSPASQAQWNVDTGYFPVNLAAHEEQNFKDNLEAFPQFQTAIDQLHDSTADDQGALAGVAQEARQVFENELEKVINGETDPKSAAQAMADQINKAIENYNQANQ